MSVRLLALDIDGTLLGSDQRVSARNRAALRAAVARGVRVVLTTGRRLPSARGVAEQLDAPVDLALHNGALIVEDGVVLRVIPLARETAAQAIRIGRAHGADPVLHVGQAGEGRLLAEPLSPGSTLLAYYLERSHPDVTLVEDLLAALSEDPLQVMFGGVLARMNALLPELQRPLAGRVRVERTAYPERGLAILDVLGPEAGKAGAVAFLQRRWGIAPEATLAIGDNWNDHEMLERAGLGLVMGNADPATLALGLPVLPRNDQDGVAFAIERYVLEQD